MERCHICGQLEAETKTVKCKLCCDGVEHEFCQACAHDDFIMRSKFGTLDAGASFTSLQLRRAAWIDQLKGGAA